jgi:hypothetical protein
VANLVQPEMPSKPVATTVVLLAAEQAAVLPSLMALLSLAALSSLAASPVYEYPAW